SEIETVARAVAVHAGQQNFAGTERRQLARPRDGVEAGGAPAAVGIHLPTRRRTRRALRVDRDHDALRAEAVGGAGDEVRIGDRGGIDRYLVGAGVQHVAHVIDAADAAAD